MIFGTPFEKATLCKKDLGPPQESLFYTVVDDLNDFAMIWADFLHCFGASYPMHFQFVGLVAAAF